MQIQEKIKQFDFLKAKSYISPYVNIYEDKQHNYAIIIEKEGIKTTEFTVPVIKRTTSFIDHQTGEIVDLKEFKNRVIPVLVEKRNEISPAKSFYKIKRTKTINDIITGLNLNL